MNKAHKRVLLLAYIAGIEAIDSDYMRWEHYPCDWKAYHIREFLAWLKINEDKHWGMIQPLDYTPTPSEYCHICGKKLHPAWIEFGTCLGKCEREFMDADHGKCWEPGLYSKNRSLQ